MCTHVVDIFQNVTTYLHINAQPLGLRFMMSDWLNLSSTIVTEANSGFEDSEVLCREKGRAGKTCEENLLQIQQLQRMHFCSQRIYIWNFQVCFFLLQWCYQTAFPEQKTHRTRKNRDQRDWGWDHDTLVGAIKSLQSEAGPTNSELIGSYLCHRVTGWTPHFHALPSGACHPSNEKKGPQVVWGM